MKRGITISIIIALILLPIVSTLLVCLLFEISDISSYVGGLFSYFGTIVLGIVAFIQNDKLHKMERVSKKSKILFTGEFFYSEHKPNSQFVANSEMYPSNYYLLSDNQSFKGEKFIDIIFPINSIGYELNDINLNYVKINEDDSDNKIEIYKNGKVKTELVYSVKNKSYQIELVIMCAELESIKSKIKQNDFILSINYTLTSSADVKSTYNTKLNFGDFLSNTQNNNIFEVDNISYMEENTND